MDYIPPAVVATRFRLRAVRGFDLAVLSELLPAVEAGLIEPLCAGRIDPIEA